MLGIDFSELKEYILDNLQAKVEQLGLNDYTTFGKEVEQPLSDVIEEYLKSKDIEYTAHRAPDKNTFPDLEITFDGELYAWEHKAGKDGDDAANDMGTLNQWPEKIEEYGDKIYYFFVKYSKASDGEGIKIEDVYIDKVYRFVGKKRHKTLKLLKYRKKDGNLRPKSWNDFKKGKVYFKTFDEFVQAIPPTVAFRAKSLVDQYLKALTIEDKLLVFHQLKEELEIE